jgi:hypothetical protein
MVRKVCWAFDNEHVAADLAVVFHEAYKSVAFVFCLSAHATGRLDFEVNLKPPLPSGGFSFVTLHSFVIDALRSQPPSLCQSP